MAPGATSSTVTWTGTGEPGATIQAFNSGSAVASTTVSAAGTWTMTVSGLPEGTLNVTTRATDAAGNTSSASGQKAVRIDTVAPDTTLGAVTGTSFPFSSNDSGATFQCRLDGPGSAVGTYGACTSPKAYSGLADGTYTFYVRAADQAGNVDATAAASTFTIDTAAPGAPVFTSPADNAWSASSTVTLSGTAEAGATVELFEGSTSKGTASASISGAWTRSVTGLSDGAHTFTARARDAAGNTGGASATRTLRVDTAAPDTSITGATTGASPSFSFGSTESPASFECRLDGPGSTVGTFVACTSPKAYSGLTSGTYTFRVRALDAAGNVDGSPAVTTWTISGGPATPPAQPTSRPVELLLQRHRDGRRRRHGQAGMTVEILDDATGSGPPPPTSPAASRQRSPMSRTALTCTRRERATPTGSPARRRRAWCSSTRRRQRRPSSRRRPRTPV